MKSIKRYWVSSGKKSQVTIPSQIDKIEIQEYFQPLIENFKINCIKKNPNKEFNYLIDIYSKWNKNYFYICEKYKSERKNRLKDEFEVNLVRLKFLEKNLFELSYLRHTGQWQTILPIPFTLKECKEMMTSNPILQPNN
jgi:hypothetical protein